MGSGKHNCDQEPDGNSAFNANIIQQCDNKGADYRRLNVRVVTYTYLCKHVQRSGRFVSEDKIPNIFFNYGRNPEPKKL